MRTIQRHVRRKARPMRHSEMDVAEVVLMEAKAHAARTIQLQARAAHAEEPMGTAIRCHRAALLCMHGLLMHAGDSWHVRGAPWGSTARDRFARVRPHTFAAAAMVCGEAV